MTLLNPLWRAAALLLLGVASDRAAAADPVPARPDPANAAATVPATRYQGALPYRPAPAQTTSADQNWHAANRTVAAYDSMALTMAGHDNQPSAQQHDEQQPQEPPKQTAAAAPHAHHQHGVK